MSTGTLDTDVREVDTAVLDQKSAAESPRVIAHGKHRFGRFALAGAAMVGMVSVAMFTGGQDTSGPALLATPETTANTSPGGGAGAILEPAGPGAAPAVPDRIGNSSAVDTSIAVSQRKFPGGAARVYVARLDNPVDALSASVFTDGPVLLTPQNGNVPRQLFEEIKRVHPSQIVVLGGEGAVSEQVKHQLGVYTGVQNVVRVAGANRVQTASAIATFGYPQGASTVYLANALGPDGTGSPDAVAGGVLRDGPILTVTGNPADITTAQQASTQLGVSRLVVLGGAGAINDEVAKRVAGGASVDRIAGKDRYETAKAIGQHVFGNSAAHVYLTPGNDLKYALIAGTIKDGPVLLMPPTANTSLRPLVTAFGNPLVHAVGPDSAVSDQVMKVAAGYAEAPAPNANQKQQSPLVAGVTQGYNRYSLPPSPADAAREEAVFRAVNAERAARGLGQLQRDPVMDDAARAWAQEVARTGVFVHSHGKLKYADLFPGGWKLAGENMVGFYAIEPEPYAQGARQAWVNSPGHLANLARPVFNRTGIGVATGRDWVYCVQNFGQY